jgi:putative membrane protein
MPMWGWDAGWGWLPMLLYMAMWLFVGGLVVWLLLRAVSGASSRSGPRGPRPDDPEEVLRARFARGEIDAEEFEQRLAVLRRTRPPGP